MLGVLPGIVGSLQANEALKLVLGMGNPLIGRLMLFDALEATLHRAAGAARPEVPRVRRRPHDHGVHRLRGVLRGGKRRLMASVRIPPPLRTETGGEPVVAVEWTIWRCRFDSSTTSSSTIPSVPTPAAARYSDAGDPSPPAPISRTRESSSFSCPSSPPRG